MRPPGFMVAVIGDPAGEGFMVALMGGFVGRGRGEAGSPDARRPLEAGGTLTCSPRCAATLAECGTLRDGVALGSTGGPL